MSANNHNAQYGANTRNRAPALPEKFKCHVGGEWASKDMFSKNQLAKWENRKRSPNDGVTPANIGMTCRIHSGQPANQLKCHGTCGLLKSRDKFSASQRRNKNPWCVDCIKWQSQIDYDSVPVPHPNGDVSLDEMNTGTRNADGAVTLNTNTPTVKSGTGNTGDVGDVDENPEGSFHGDSDTSDGYDDDDYDYDDDEDMIRRSDIGAPAVINQPMTALSLGTSRTASYPTTTSIAAHAANTRERGIIPQVTNAQNSMGRHHQMEAPWATVMPVAAPSNIPPHKRAPGSSPNNTVGKASISRPLQGSSTTQDVQEMSRSSVPPHKRVISPADVGFSNPQAMLPPHLRSTHRGKGPGSPTPSMTNASDALKSAMPTEAIEWRPQHLKGSQAPVKPSTMSVVSSGSRDGVDTISTTSQATTNNGDRAGTDIGQRRYNAYGPGGEVMMRTTGRPQSETTVAVSGGGEPKRTQGASDRRRPDKNGFARPDMRRVFDTVVEFHNNAQDGIEVRDSGSEDEM